MTTEVKDKIWQKLGEVLSIDTALNYSVQAYTQKGYDVEKV